MAVAGSTDSPASRHAVTVRLALRSPMTLSWDWITNALVNGVDNRVKDREGASLRVLVTLGGDIATSPEVQQNRFSRPRLFLRYPACHTVKAELRSVLRSGSLLRRARAFNERAAARRKETEPNE